MRLKNVLFLWIIAVTISSTSTALAKSVFTPVSDSLPPADEYIFPGWTPAPYSWQEPNLTGLKTPAKQGAFLNASTVIAIMAGGIPLGAANVLRKRRKKFPPPSS